MSKSEKTISKDEIPTYRYRLSPHAIKSFGAEKVKEGIYVENILLFPHFTNAGNKVNAFDRLLVSKQNPQNVVEYEKIVPRTGEVLETNIEYTN